MIGFFLVLVAACCALGRELRNALLEVLYRRRIGRIIIASWADPWARVVLVQYFVKGKEYWYWDNIMSGKSTPARSEYKWLLRLRQRRGPHRVDAAYIRVSGLSVPFLDVTQFVRELSGPRMDFYGGIGALEGRFLETYLHRRLYENSSTPVSIHHWDFCDVHIVPGSMIKPDRFVFPKRDRYL